VHRFRIWLLLACLGLAAIVPARALRKEDVRPHTLDNGLRVLLLPDPAIPNVAMYTFFRVGSRNERPGITGVSHFIEHMMFNGTAAIGPGEFDRRMESFGGSNNASTSEDVTIFMDWFPADSLESMLSMEADRIQGLAFDPAVLESERGVVASERRLVVENDSEGMLEENLRATAIMAHPYHWDVVGWMSDIQGWQRADIVQYYRTFYAPNNAVLVVVGDFDAALALEWITRYYGSIPAEPTPPAVTTVEPPQMGTKRVVLRREALTPSFSMAFHVPGCNDPDFAPLEILEKILLEGESARLHRRLVRQDRLATEVSGGVQTTLDPYLFEISVKPVGDADTARIEAAVQEELDKIRTAGVSDRELQKALNRIRSDHYFGLETIADRALQLGLAEVFYGGFDRLFTRMDRYTSLTPEDIRRVAGKYFTPRNLTVGILLPEKPKS
jgi:zinc protease